MLRSRSLRGRALALICRQAARTVPVHRLGLGAAGLPHCEL